jgi:hypothetical protein
MKNLLLTLLLFMSSLAYSQNVIIDTLNCPSASVTLTQIVPTNVDCDSIWGTHLFWVNFPANPADSIETWWDIYFYNIVVEPISIMFPPFAFPQSGCYRYDVALACPTGNVTILTSTYYVSTLGIEELANNQRKLIKVIDLMGRETEIQPNKTLIKCYSDGTTERFYINE